LPAQPAQLCVLFIAVALLLAGTLYQKEGERWKEE